MCVWSPADCARRWRMNEGPPGGLELKQRRACGELRVAGGRLAGMAGQHSLTHTDTEEAHNKSQPRMNPGLPRCLTATLLRCYGSHMACNKAGRIIQGQLSTRLDSSPRNTLASCRSYRLGRAPRRKGTAMFTVVGRTDFLIHVLFFSHLEGLRAQLNGADEARPRYLLT